MILIVSNSRDFGTDDIVRHLRAGEVEYLRLDIDLLHEDEIALDPLRGSLTHRLRHGSPRYVSRPTSILYRAPTHLSESAGHRYAPEQLLQRHQWAAFCRSLTVFRDALWVNHPAATYLAENKPYQLITAAECGFSVPETGVANALPQVFSEVNHVAVKTLDTFLVRKDAFDHFFYTTMLDPEECTPARCRDMPLIFQSYLEDKVDLRITVVGEQCFIAETTATVEGDWRRQKERVQFRAVEDREEISECCRRLMRRLNLKYAAIDCARTPTQLWFLEINPTGEWAWLDPTFDGQISKSLAQLLAG